MHYKLVLMVHSKGNIQPTQLQFPFIYTPYLWVHLLTRSLGLNVQYLWDSKGWKFSFAISACCATSPEEKWEEEEELEKGGGVILGRIHGSMASWCHLLECRVPSAHRMAMSEYLVLSIRGS